jgi:hypothetical protein
MDGGNEERGYSQMRSLIKGYGREKRLGTAVLCILKFRDVRYVSVIKCTMWKDPTQLVPLEKIFLVQWLVLIGRTQLDISLFTPEEGMRSRL